MFTVKILNSDGLMIQTVLHVYIKHNDPIDNLSSFFPKFKKIDEKTLDTYRIFYSNSKFNIFKSLLRFFLTFFYLKVYETKFWSIIWMFKKRKVSYLVLKKENK